MVYMMKGKVSSLRLMAIIWTASSDAARQAACGDSGSEAAARWENTQTVTNGMESQRERHRSAIIDRRKKAIKSYSYSLK